VSLTITNSELNDIGLNKICSSCRLIEYLDVQINNYFLDLGDVEFFITKEGLNNIHRLAHLKSLFLYHASDNWLAKLSHNTALTYLDLSYYSTVSDVELSKLSSLVNLTSVVVEGKERLSRIL
jgi:hypothetical protein